MKMLEGVQSIVQLSGLVARLCKIGIPSENFLVPL